MFSTPELIVWDGLRLVAALASLVVSLTTPWIVMGRAMTWHQRLRFIGAALVGAAIVSAYLQALGTVPRTYWHTVAISIGMVMLAIGWVTYLRSTVPISPPRRHRR